MDTQTIIHPFKIVLVGENKVGKTNIISQFISHTFQEQYQQTAGASFSTKFIPIDDKNSFKYDIWDTAGNEKYRPLTKVFIKDADAVILVYDITREYTFDEIKNYWIDETRKNSKPSCVLALVANKYDLIENEVDEEKSLLFAEDKKAMFFHTSAKKEISINNLFYKLANKLLEKENKGLKIDFR